jgi:serine/threonine protein kinase
MHRKRRVFQEIYILKKLRHNNVTRLLEVFEAKNHLMIVLEYASAGDALALSKTKVSENQAREIFHQVVHGVGHLHCRSIAHRDIKLENIMLIEDV